MESDSIFIIIGFFALLFLSAILKGSETAFFSLNRMVLRKLTEQGDYKNEKILRLLDKPRQLLITILSVNVFVKVTAIVLAIFYTRYIFLQLGVNYYIGLISSIVLVSLLIILVSELSPKIFVVKNPQNFAFKTAPAIRLMAILFYPFTLLVEKYVNYLIEILKIKKADDSRLMLNGEFQALLEFGEEQGELEVEEKEMIHSIFEFGDTIVREIMVPRTDMVCIPDTISLEEIIKLIEVKGHTRIPVFKESIDHISGILNAKDLLPSVIEKQQNIDILKLSRTAIFVPESKKIDDLLRVFQKKRQHMAIVVDEYGGTAGLVTLEDVLEEIVGEIRDEYDQEMDLFKRIDENTMLINAKIDVHSLNELIDINIPEKDEYDTFGGFIFDVTGYVPQENEVIRYGDYEIVMVKVEQNRILNVKVQYNPLEEIENVNHNSSK